MQFPKMGMVMQVIQRKSTQVLTDQPREGLVPPLQISTFSKSIYKKCKRFSSNFPRVCFRNILIEKVRQPCNFPRISPKFYPDSSVICFRWLSNISLVSPVIICPDSLKFIFTPGRLLSSPQQLVICARYRQFCDFVPPCSCVIIPR